MGQTGGFFMDNDTGKLGELYPLMDHDHGFSEEEEILSQTSEERKLKGCSPSSCGDSRLGNRL